MPALHAAYVRYLGREYKFQDRSGPRPPFVGRAARLPRTDAWSPPATSLPVDSTGDGRVDCPMDDNNVYGDCGEAMLAHRYQIIKFRQGQGQQYEFELDALVDQYFQVSGGDNGLSEPQTIQILETGVGGTTDDAFLGALDVDVTDIPLAQFLIDQFATIQVAWSVPDAFLDSFTPGSSWSGAMTPDPSQGHYTPIADVAGPGSTVGGDPIEGFYRLYTWGAWCWVSPAFLASVAPSSFVVFSLGLYDPTTGLDSKGRHVVNQAQLWELAGGDPIPAATLAQFPQPAANPNP